MAHWIALGYLFAGLVFAWWFWQTRMEEILSEIRDNLPSGVPLVSALIAVILLFSLGMLVLLWPVEVWGRVRSWRSKP